MDASNKAIYVEKGVDVSFGIDSGESFSIITLQPPPI